MKNKEKKTKRIKEKKIIRNDYDANDESNDG